MTTASITHLADIASSLSSHNPDSQRSHGRAGRYAHLPQQHADPSLASLPQHHTVPSLASLPHEDRDAALTGSTRSLARRLFALNLHAQVAQPLPASPHRPAATTLLRSA